MEIAILGADKKAVIANAKLKALEEALLEEELGEFELPEFEVPKIKAEERSILLPCLGHTHRKFIMP